MWNFKSILAMFVGTLMLLTTLGSFYTIDETERGVKTRMGVIVSTVEPGFGWKSPFIEDVTTFDVTVQKADYGVQALSKDSQRATMALAINYQLDPSGVEAIYRQFNGNQQMIVDKVINPAVYEISVAKFGQYTAQKSIEEREHMADSISTALVKELHPYGIRVKNVQILGVTFSDEYLHSIEERMKAEVEVQKFHQNLEREKIEADIKRTQADASAYQTLATAKAEAEGINLRGKALRDNPDLIELTKAEKWNGVLPTTMVPGSAVPFLDVGKKVYQTTN